MDNKTYIAKEMMFGTQDEFEYLKCNNCFCLQLIDLPLDLSRYYPINYYSLKKPSQENLFLKNLRLYLRYKRSKYLLSKKGFLGKVIFHFSDDYFERNSDWDWFRKTGTHLNSNILDIGCGTGKLLRHMDNQGFTKLSGLDPYIEEDIVFGIRNKHIIYKKFPEQHNGDFDLVMLHHSFEHMQDPIFILKQINRLLKINHFALLRVPLCDSYAWEKYGVNWVQLDAPRHLFLHTIKSIQILSNLTGFEISDIVYDSTSFQFIGSEMYLRNISLEHSKKIQINKIFSEKVIDTFKRDAEKLNLKNEGDQACFYLKKIKSINI